ncbi:hypothetical protein Ddye_022079 [Dipteronia dyeriana]|uniref:PGG domain-containing protein n=1 Tax=Dipteronia dyeriana TaxID=168575 RepID=A0AAD9U2W8_9ROSI|nr:hypothetical protein Ddye_022079 [Dipteronia dyeriana]
MEPITAGSAADPENPARTIELPEIDESATFSQGSQNQNDAPSRSHEISIHSKFAALNSSAVNGDWREAKRLLRDDPQLVLLRTAITELQETALHVATGERQVYFVVKLINLMKPEDLTLRDRNGNTAFCIAAADGSIQIANVMLEKNKNLLTIRGFQNMLPLFMAVLLGKKEMSMFLYGLDTFYLTSQDRTGLFFQSIKNDLYDFALRLLNDKPELALYRDEDEDTALHVLGRKPSSIFNQQVKFSRNQESIPAPALQLLNRVRNATKQHFVDIKDLTKYSSNLLFDAARLGNSRFLEELIRSYPSLVHEFDTKGRSIFHVAILHRQTSVFNLIHKIGFHKEIIAANVDDDGNSMLHLAAKYSDQSPETALSSAALEMQKELIIFRVEKLIQPSLRGAKNADGLTPRELFASDHTSLQRSGALWMNNTATSCSLVATLIATVVFAAAFTVPGGADGKTGTPILLKKTLFRVFAISDAIALSSSSFSILMFLSILTSGYTQSQFYRSLPLKLMIGLLALFISILFMMITFSSTYFLLHHDQSLCIPTLTVVFVSVPISLFVLLQYPLLRDMFHLIRRSGFLFLSKSGFLSK